MDTNGKHTHKLEGKEKKNTLFGILKEELSTHTQYPLANEPRARKCCNSDMLCSEKVLMVQPSCIITHKQERPGRTVGVFKNPTHMERAERVM